ncbi:DUF1203 domain-containing protein [Jiulongibacter sp. NS-SX5]|uniref:DUF1203 domain-containing protein n=1 Tax=Jiulongibacter sp. NS-SX5 TaxID=3463854 RepID=UPI00405958F2
MDTNFRITAINEDFQNLFDLDEDELKKIGAVIMVVDEKPGFPCRLSLEDAHIGEEVILFPYEHHKVESPYRASGPIFVRKNVTKANLEINEIPVMLEHRLLSLRIYNEDAMMIDARTVHGSILKKEIQDVFKNQKALYIQVHNAGPGCYNCQINRSEKVLA